MDEALYYNAIACGLEGNYARIAEIKNQYPDWASAYHALATQLPSLPDPEKAWQAMQAEKINLVLQEDAAYPESLREISQPPFGIYYKGTLPDGASSMSFAIIGTRRATPEGKNIAHRFAEKLAEVGWTIVSGLAFGIDCAAHAGTLEARGKTIAVLANGLDAVYPASNTGLANNILAKNGTIISEYPIGSPALPYRFLERNRIVSGLAKGILVVESPERSGSLATARFALEQNRDVFVVPGPISHPNFFGSHALIRQGAELVTKPEEILEAYGLVPEEMIIKKEEGATTEEKLILQALRSNPIPQDIDKIISLTKLEPHIANQAITFLLLKKMIKENGSGYTI